MTRWSATIPTSSATIARWASCIAPIATASAGWCPISVPRSSISAVATSRARRRPVPVPRWSIAPVATARARGGSIRAPRRSIVCIATTSARGGSIPAPLRTIPSIATAGRVPTILTTPRVSTKLTTPRVSTILTTRHRGGLHPISARSSCTPVGWDVLQAAVGNATWSSLRRTPVCHLFVNNRIPDPFRQVRYDAKVKHNDDLSVLHVVADKLVQSDHSVGLHLL